MEWLLSRVGAASSSYLPYLYISFPQVRASLPLGSVWENKRGSAGLEYKGCGPNEYLSVHLMTGLKAHLPEDKRGGFLYSPSSADRTAQQFLVLAILSLTA